MQQPQMRARIWIDGDLVVDEKVDLDNLEATQARHQQIVDQAERAGKVYCVEMSDDEGEIAPVRWGTDVKAMVDPQPYTDELWQELMEQRDPRRQQ